MNKQKPQLTNTNTRNLKQMLYLIPIAFNRGRPHQRSVLRLERRIPLLLLLLTRLFLRLELRPQSPILRLQLLLLLPEARDLVLLVQPVNLKVLPDLFHLRVLDVDGKRRPETPVLLLAQRAPRPHPAPDLRPGFHLIGDALHDPLAAVVLGPKDVVIFRCKKELLDPIACSSLRRHIGVGQTNPLKYKT